MREVYLLVFVCIFSIESIYSHQYIIGINDKEGNSLLVSNIKASSFLYDKKYNHKPEMSCDYDEKTAWCVKGNGKGEWIRFDVEESQLHYKGIMNLYRVLIKNGLTINNKFYYSNNRVKKLLFEFSGGERKIIELKDNRLDYQIFVMNIKTKWIKITIQDIYKGEKYNDTCISELNFETWKHPSEMDASEKKYFGY